MKRSFPLSLNVIKNYQFYSSRTFSSSSLLQVKLHNINPSPSISHSSLSLRQLLSTSNSSNKASPFQYRSHTSTALTMSPPPSLAPGNTALITGGASGIGLSLAIKCLGYGMNIILVDNHGDNLGAAQTYLTQKSNEKQQVVGLKIDVGKAEEWESVKEVVEGDFDGTSSLLLNRGWIIGGTPR